MLRYSDGLDGLDDLLTALRPVAEPSCGLYLALSRGIAEGRLSARGEVSSWFGSGPSCTTSSPDQEPGPRIVSPDPAPDPGTSGPRLARGSAGHLPPRRGRDH